MQALLVNVASAPAHAQSMALQIFGGLDKAAQEDVVHTFQGSTNAVKTTDPQTLAKIQERATLLRQYTDDLTSKQVASGTLKEGTAEANPDHFGMRGAYKNPHLTQEQDEVFKRGQGVGGGGVTREGSEKTQAQYRTLNEAQTSAKADLKDDFHVATQAGEKLRARPTQHRVRRRGQGCAFDTPSTRREVHADAPSQRRCRA